MSGAWCLTLFALCVTCTGARNAISLGDHYDTFNYFYKELGCVKNEKTAASAFDCPEFPSKNGSCRFLHSYIPSGAKVDQELLKGSCIPECICKEDGFLLCPGTDCGLQFKEGCHQRNSLDTCCPTGLVCGDDIAQCEIEGKTYKEGEKVYLKNSCDVCVCDKGFKQEAPFCRPIKCNLEANRAQELTDHAAPVYLKDQICCPTTWIIDEGEDQIETIVADVKGPACTFGKKKIGYGEGFQRKISRFGVEMEVKCECYSPPFVICNEEAASHTSSSIVNPSKSSKNTDKSSDISEQILQLMTENNRLTQDTLEIYKQLQNSMKQLVDNTNRMLKCSCQTQESLPENKALKNWLKLVQIPKLVQNKILAEGYSLQEFLEHITRDDLRKLKLRGASELRLWLAVEEMRKKLEIVL